MSAARDVQLMICQRPCSHLKIYFTVQLKKKGNYILDGLRVSQITANCKFFGRTMHGFFTTLAFSGLLVTEYTISTAVSLLPQGNQAIEDYVTNFCGLCHLVNCNNVAVKDIFRVGLNEPIRSQLPGGRFIERDCVQRLSDCCLFSITKVNGRPPVPARIKSS